MPRPLIDDPRLLTVCIRLTFDEKRVLVKRAKAASMPVSEFVRAELFPPPT